MGLGEEVGGEVDDVEEEVRRGSGPASRLRATAMSRSVVGVGSLPLISIQTEGREERAMWGGEWVRGGLGLRGCGDKGVGWWPVGPAWWGKWASWAG